MVCTRYGDALNDLAAGGLASPDLASHLKDCGSCRKTLAVLEQMLAVADEEFGRLAAQDPSPGFTLRIRAAVDKPRFTPSLLQGWLRPSLVTATVLVAALALVLKLHPVQAPPTIAQVRPQEIPAFKPAEGPGSSLPATAATRSETALARKPASVDARVASAGVPVLIPAGESAALMEFMSLVSVERVIPAGLGVSGDPSPDLAVPELSTPDLAALVPMSIKPIEIVPLEQDANPGI